MDLEAVYIHRAFILLSDSWTAYHVYILLYSIPKGGTGGEKQYRDSCHNEFDHQWINIPTSTFSKVY